MSANTAPLYPGDVPGWFQALLTDPVLLDAVDDAYEDEVLEPYTVEMSENGEEYHVVYWYEPTTGVTVAKFDSYDAAQSDLTTRMTDNDDTWALIILGDKLVEANVDTLRFSITKDAGTDLFHVMCQPLSYWPHSFAVSSGFVYYNSATTYQALLEALPSLALATLYTLSSEAAGQVGVAEEPIRFELPDAQDFFNSYNFDTPQYPDLEDGITSSDTDTILPQPSWFPTRVGWEWKLFVADCKDMGLDPYKMQPKRLLLVRNNIVNVLTAALEGFAFKHRTHRKLREFLYAIITRLPEERCAVCGGTIYGKAPSYETTCDYKKCVSLT